LRTDIKKTGASAPCSFAMPRSLWIENSSQNGL
jgi:hypothetical protein